MGTESEQILTSQQQESGRQHTCIKAKHQSEYDLTFLKTLRLGVVRGTRSLHKLADHISLLTFSMCAANVFVRDYRNEKPIQQSIENPDWRK